MTAALKRFTETFHKRNCRSTSTSTSGPSRSSRRSRGAASRRAAPRAAAAGPSSVPGEPDCAGRLADHDPDRARRARWRRRPRPRATWRLSCPLGIEALPPDEAAPLLDACHEGVAGAARARSAPGPRRALSEPDPADARRASSTAAFVGRRACPPRRSRDRRASTRCGPLLEVLERRGAPLLVHPGPRPARCARRRAAARRRGGRRSPATWPRMNAAWHAFAARGAGRRTRGCASCFAMLAGLAPLHARAPGRARRPAARRRPATPSSTPRRTAPRAIDAVVRDARRRRARARLRPARWSAAPRSPALGDAGRSARCASATRRACWRIAERRRREPRAAPRARPRPRRAARPGRAGSPPIRSSWRHARRATTPSERALRAAAGATTHVAVWVICWMDGPRHRLPRPRPLGRRGGGRATGEVRRGAPARSAARRAGASTRRARRSTSAPPDIHRVRHAGGGPAITIHAYSPPLWRMGAYEVDADGDAAPRTRSPTPRSCGPADSNAA